MEDWILVGLFGYIMFTLGRVVGFKMGEREGLQNYFHEEWLENMRLSGNTMKKTPAPSRKESHGL